MPSIDHHVAMAEQIVRMDLSDRTSSYAGSRSPAHDERVHGLLIGSIGLE